MSVFTKNCAAMLLVAMLCGCSLVDLGTGGTRPAPPVPVAVWSYLDLPGSASEREAFFQFAQGFRVRELYLGAGDWEAYRAEPWSAFLQEAGARGITVSLVIGRADWIRSERREVALEMIQDLRDWNANLRRQGLWAPSSVQLDVEPYALKDWKRDWKTLSGQYLDFLEAVRRELGGELPLWVDIPVWWDNLPVRRGGRTRPLSEWVIGLADRTILMDYRNHVPGIISGAAAEVAAAGALNRKVVLGLAVHCDHKPDEASTSFCQKGHRSLVRAMGQVEDVMGERRGYGGMAVFTYEDWRQLRN